MALPTIDIDSETFTVEAFVASTNGIIAEVNSLQANTSLQTQITDLSASKAANTYVNSQISALSSSFTSSLSTKLNLSSYTASDVLAKMLSVDGLGSGLDAEFLGGNPVDFYRNASNLNQGTVPNGRLSGDYIGISNITVSGLGTFGSLAGNGTNVSNVNAVSLGGQSANFYQSASNMNAGVLPDGRLSGSYNGFVNITGTGTASFAKNAVANGAVATPSYSFTNDGDTGLYLVSDGNLAISANSVQRVLVNSTGVTVTGAVSASGQITGFSDGRLKEDVQVIQNASKLLTNLEGVRYTMNGKHGTVEGERGIGVIAQQILPYLPELVNVPENPDEPMSVAYGQFAGLFIEVFKEILERLDQLESKNDN